MIQQPGINQLCSTTLLGNLVAKPDIRYLANPVLAMTEFTLATHSKWLDKSTHKFKEWTSYHHVKIVGPLVEQTLLHVQKGDLVLVHGYLANSKSTPHEVVIASFIQTFAKGYTQSINQIHCSGTLSSPIKLMTTEHNKELAQAQITVTHQEYSPIKEMMRNNRVERTLHIWGKQALHLHEQAHEGDTIVVEGRLNYSSGADKSQFIDCKRYHLFKN